MAGCSGASDGDRCSMLRGAEWVGRGATTTPRLPVSQGSLTAAHAASLRRCLPASCLCFLSAGVSPPSQCLTVPMPHWSPSCCCRWSSAAVRACPSCSFLRICWAKRSYAIDLTQKQCAGEHCFAWVVMGSRQEPGRLRSGHAIPPQGLVTAQDGQSVRGQAYGSLDLCVDDPSWGRFAA